MLNHFHLFSEVSLFFRSNSIESNKGKSQINGLGSKHLGSAGDSNCMKCQFNPDVVVLENIQLWNVVQNDPLFCQFLKSGKNVFGKINK